MSTKYDTCVYIKIRYVGRSYKPSYEAKIIGRREAGIWDTLGTTRGHATAESARAAILKLADRRGIRVTDDPRGLRAVQFKDTYGDDHG
jgi:hypothetical protein